ncbi:hypothetical protein T459_31362 [Capsicum annuum]|uniref:Heat shock factor-binding protein 1-like n=1 Tax=Capsicum annuum TaxID=4072 RepID=A0A2G2YB08_CAPAN|nr:hypothetical protein T459_31362 [Capsicum annuum]
MSFSFRGYFILPRRDGQDGDNKQSTADMTVFVQNLLQQMVSPVTLQPLGFFASFNWNYLTDIFRFAANQISDNVCMAFGRNASLNKACLVLDKSVLDEMGNRIDELEQSINDLRGEMGQDAAAPSPSASLKPKEEPTKPADDSA